VWPDVVRLPFRWNGRALQAQTGDSIAAALAEAGIVTFGTSRTGRERGLFCGMGICLDCLVIVGGKRSQRACMTKVRAGMSVQAQSDTGVCAISALPPPSETTDITVDLAIVGAGPAGLNAALVAMAAGATVCVIDERSEIGGQYYKPRSDGYRGSTAVDFQHRKGSVLRQSALKSGVTIRSGETVWFARAAEDRSVFTLRTDGPGGKAHISARAVVLATGALERPAMIPGWTRPGVMTIGAAQTLVRRYGVAPGSKVLVAGHGPLGLQLAVEMRKLGADVVAVAERGQPRQGIALMRAAWAVCRS